MDLLHKLPDFLQNSAYKIPLVLKTFSLYIARLCNSKWLVSTILEGKFRMLVYKNKPLKG